LLRIKSGELYPEDGGIAYVSEFTLEVPLPRLSADDLPWLVHQLSWGELVRDRNAVLGELAAIAAKLDAMEDSPGPEGQDRAGLEHQRAAASVSLTYLETQLVGRPAIAFGSLCFVLVGCPIGMRFAHRGYLGAFFIGLLPIIVVYY